MGMFDSLYDAKSNEWQTKAFDCDLDNYGIGDPIPADGALTFQVEILGERDGGFPWSLATVRNGVLEAVDVDRDPTLPLVGYSGGVLEMGAAS